MYLQRKVGSPTIVTNDGIPHPNIVFQLFDVPANLFKDKITFDFAFYHDDSSLDNGYTRIGVGDPLYNVIRYSFSDDTTPDFQTVLDMFDFSDGVVLINETAVANWVLQQWDPLAEPQPPDFDSIPFSENWEFIAT